ncbi:MAG TPA: CHAD domain-containing protein [Polyangia bacterium]|nr:CHAD domain-containing protein [Polyangia bacterium]
MAFNIEPGESTPHAIARMARHELAGARHAVSDERRSLAARVHAVRMAIKKVRALSRLVESAAGRPARRADRRLRKVAHAVSGARDAEVALTAFDQMLAGAKPEASAPFMRARAALAARLRAEVVPLRRTSHVKRLRARLTRELRRVKRWRPKHDRWRSIGGGLDDGYRRARRAMSAAYLSGASADFHAWRRAVKTHRHQLGALEPIAPRRLRPRLDDLDRLGELLGEDHDLVVLEQTLRDERASFPDERSCDRLLRSISARRLRLRAKARPLGQRLFDERPSRFRERLRRAFKAFRAH